jgi:sulfite exporter TauE/SafE
MLTALCGSLAALPLGGGIAFGLLIAGIAGSAAHCVPMCGGFVLAQVVDRMARVPAARLCEWRRLSTGVLPPYHLGRLTTYGGLGALAGLGGSALERVPWFGFASGTLLTAAAFLFLMQALRRLLPWQLSLSLDRAPAWWHHALNSITRTLDTKRACDGYLMGAALGFLPCGFLYAALAAAAASADPLHGAVAMLAFGLGTVPALIAVGIAGQAAAHRWQRGVSLASPAVMLVNAALLLLLAFRNLVT